MLGGSHPRDKRKECIWATLQEGNRLPANLMFKLAFVLKTQAKQRGAVYSGTHLSPSTRRTEAGGLEFQLKLDYRGHSILKSQERGCQERKPKHTRVLWAPPRSSLGVSSPSLPHLK